MRSTESLCSAACHPLEHLHVGEHICRCLSCLAKHFPESTRNKYSCSLLFQMGLCFPQFSFLIPRLAMSFIIWRQKRGKMTLGQSSVAAVCAETVDAQHRAEDRPCPNSFFRFKRTCPILKKSWCQNTCKRCFIPIYYHRRKNCALTLPRKGSQVSCGINKDNTPFCFEEKSQRCLVFNGNANRVFSADKHSSFE